MAFDSNLALAMGQQVTVTSTNLAAARDRFLLLKDRAAAAYPSVDDPAAKVAEMSAIRIDQLCDTTLDSRTGRQVLAPRFSSEINKICYPDHVAAWCVASFPRSVASASILWLRVL
ncbi:MAG: hypothetical protein U9Q81_15315 [Pseudomonadota bacterium]|nr:hypothetical protein [Pseudomonadota bacterium]